MTGDINKRSQGAHMFLFSDDCQWPWPSGFVVYIPCADGVTCLILLGVVSVSN